MQAVADALVAWRRSLVGSGGLLEGLQFRTATSTDAQTKKAPSCLLRLKPAAQWTSRATVPFVLEEELESDVVNDAFISRLAGSVAQLEQLSGRIYFQASPLVRIEKHALISSVLPTDPPPKGTPMVAVLTWEVVASW